MLLFFNEEKFPKQVATVRAVSFWIIFILLLMAVGFFINIALPAKRERYAYGILGTFAAFIATTIILKIEKKSFANYELKWQKNTILNFLKGIAIGALCFATMIMVLMSFTTLSIEKSNNVVTTTALLGLWYILPMAFMEEVAFRAYPFLKLKKVFGLRITQLLVAISFAIYHIVQGWDIQISFLGPGIWAFVFGLGAVWSKGIALPTGIHVALNFLQEIMGMKGNNEHCFYIMNQKSTTPSSLANTEIVGVAVQILVLVAAILLTEWLIRKNKISTN